MSTFCVSNESHYLYIYSLNQLISVSLLKNICKIYQLKNSNKTKQMYNQNDNDDDDYDDDNNNNSNIIDNN